MNILIVCSGNFENFDYKIHQSFIYEQVNAVNKLDPNINFDQFFIKGKGIKGYLKNLRKLKEQIRNKNYNYIHAHFAFSSLLANLQRKTPVITSFHGSDINNKRNRFISAVVELLSKKTIYVSEDLLKRSLFKAKKNSFVIPCGVDMDLFKPASKKSSREIMGLDRDKKYILFSSSFSNKVKNYPLARAAVDLLSETDTELLELKNYNRDEVATLMNAVDVALMTSFSEGSPQFVKEALACNCRLVSTDVGDVKSIINNIEGCFITSFDVKDVAEKLKMALDYKKPLNARGHLERYDNKSIAVKIRDLYR
jgi:teichuronic acid biosynthesis glycosyltransferase TuaC